MRLSLEELESLIQRPENVGKRFEFVGGEIVEVPLNPLIAPITARLVGAIYLYLLRNEIGTVSGNSAEYAISGDRYLPSIVFHLKSNVVAHDGESAVSPDLAVEFDSPSNNQSRPRLRIKIAKYLAAGTTLWVVVPQLKAIEVYAPGQPAKIFDINSTLNGCEILPGFTLALKNIFPEQPTKDE